MADTAPPRKPQGWPIQWGEPELEAMVRASAEDLGRAAKLWRDRAPKGLKDLLDAVRKVNRG